MQTWKAFAFSRDTAIDIHIHKICETQTHIIVCIIFCFTIDTEHQGLICLDRHTSCNFINVYVLFKSATPPSFRDSDQMLVILLWEATAFHLITDHLQSWSEDFYTEHISISIVISLINNILRNFIWHMKINTIFSDLMIFNNLMLLNNMPILFTIINVNMCLAHFFIKSITNFPIILILYFALSRCWSTIKSFVLLFSSLLLSQLNFQVNECVSFVQWKWEKRFRKCKW